MREKTFEEYQREHRSDFEGKSREELIAMLIREASVLTDDELDEVLTYAKVCLRSQRKWGKIDE